MASSRHGTGMCTVAWQWRAGSGRTHQSQGICHRSFEIDKNSGDKAGEFQHRFERYFAENAVKHTVKGAENDVYVNADGVMGTILGMGKVQRTYTATDMEDVAVGYVVKKYGYGDRLQCPRSVVNFDQGVPGQNTLDYMKESDSFPGFFDDGMWNAFAVGSRFVDEVVGNRDQWKGGMR